MAKIRKEDIFDPKLFTGTTQEINAMITAIGKLKGQMLDLIKVNKELLQTNKVDSSAGLKRQAEATQKVTQADKNLNALEKERLRLVNKLNQSATAQAKNNQRLKLQIQQRNKAIKDELKTEKQLFGAYARKSAQLAKLRKRYKDLLVAGKGNTAEAKRLAKQVGFLDKKLKQVDASAGQYQRNVGNYGNKLKAGFQSLMGAVGLTAGITGAVRVLRNAIGVVTTFDQSIANLGAVTQASDVSLAKLRKNAIKLSEVTKFTASEVADLSLELGKLGFNPDEIIESSEAILQLASATGQELSESAKITGQTIRAFNLDVEESGRVASVLGVATTKSALDMEFFNTAMSKVAPVASSLGFELEETVAMLGTLANAGFDASTAATATKNIFLKLADDGGELAQALGEPVRSMDDLIPALEQLQSELGEDGLARALELTDKRSVAAFNTFLNGTDTLEALTVGVTDVSDELKEMSEKQLDTVNGQLALLNSKWQAMILGTSDSAGAVDFLKNSIKFLTENLDAILRTVKLATIAFLSYKGGIIAVNLITKTYRAVTIGARIATIAFTQGLNRAKVAMRMFNVTMAANPIGLVVSALATGIALMAEFADETETAADAVDKLNEALNTTKADIANDVKDISIQSRKRISDLKTELAELKNQGATEKELAEKQDEIDKAEIKALEDKKKKEDELRESILARLNTIVKIGGYSVKVKDIFGDTKSNLEEIGESAKIFTSLDEVYKQAGEKYDPSKAPILAPVFSVAGNIESDLYNYDGPGAPTVRGEGDFQRAKRAKGAKRVLDIEVAKLKTLKEELINAEKVTAENQLQIDILENNIKQRKLGIDTQKKKQKAEDKGNKPLKQSNIYLREALKLKREELKLEEDLAQLQFKSDIQKLDTQSKGVLEGLYKQAQDLDFVDPDADGDTEDIVVPDTTEYFDYLKKKQLAEEDALDSAYTYQLQLEQDKYDDYIAMLDKALADGKLKQDQYDLLEEEADDRLIDRKYNVEEKYLNDLDKLNDDRVKQEEEISEELLEIAKATNEQRIQEIEDARQEELARTQEIVQATNQLLDWLQQQNDARAQKQIDNINKEIDASKKRYNELKELAIQGNADANESALFEVRRQEELERQKQKIQRNQQLVQAGIAAFKVYGEKAAQGDENPLASTISDLTALTAFISSLPTFWEGSENVGNSLGSPLLSGRDGHVVRVDSNERIVDVANNRKMSGISNDELGDLAWSYKNDTLDTLGYNKLGGTSYEMLSNSMSVNYHLSKQLNEINKSNKQIISAIEHIPNESWDYDRMTDAVIQKIKTQKKTEIKHYKNNSLF